MNINDDREAALWWRGLQPSEDRKRPGDRGALARLRRCATVLEAASEPATIALCKRLGGNERDLERAALVAGVLSHVRGDTGHGVKVARQIGVTGDGTATMSELRFRRLIQAETGDERLIAFRRLVALAGQQLNVADLGGSLWHWGDRRRLGWIYAYYDAPQFDAASTSTVTVTEDASA